MDSGNHLSRALEIEFENTGAGERRVDLFAEEKIMVEIKAIIQLENVHMAQAKNYPEVNFSATSLQFKRLENQKFVDNTIHINL
jgi:GxxExxY protein